jgi:NADPH:quinone reductase-like Zn-dependent oxidoreductase
MVIPSRARSNLNVGVEIQNDQYQERWSMSNRLENKVAVVTGGTSGIGLATAQRFALEGAKVFVTGRREKELTSAVEQIGHGAVAVQGDVSKLELLGVCRA